ncbi:hypothetical protein L195_g024752, partial [Trifolium pratense]
LSGESCLSGKKVKLPVFEGNDPVAWITRAKIYFDVQNTSGEMRVTLARLSMEGATIHCDRHLENPFKELSSLRETGSVEEFVEAFELLSSQVGRILEMMRMAKDVEEDLKEEYHRDRAYGKKPLGRNEASGPGSIFRSGFNPPRKTQPDKKNGCKLIGGLGKMGEYHTMNIEGKLVNVNVRS